MQLGVQGGEGVLFVRQSTGEEGCTERETERQREREL